MNTSVPDYINSFLGLYYLKKATNSKFANHLNCSASYLVNSNIAYRHVNLDATNLAGK